MIKPLYSGIFLDTETGQLMDGQGKPLQARPNAKRRRWPEPVERSNTFAEAGNAPKPEHYNKRHPHARYVLDPDTYWQNGKIYKRKQ